MEIALLFKEYGNKDLFPEYINKYANQIALLVGSSPLPFLCLQSQYLAINSQSAFLLLFNRTAAN